MTTSSRTVSYHRNSTPTWLTLFTSWNPSPAESAYPHVMGIIPTHPPRAFRFYKEVQVHVMSHPLDLGLSRGFRPPKVQVQRLPCGHPACLQSLPSGSPSARQRGDWGLRGEALRAKGRAEQGQEVGKPRARLTTNYFRQPLGLENSTAMGSSQKLC